MNLLAPSPGARFHPSRADEFAYRAAMRRDPCAYCWAASDTLDHIRPRSRGGANHSDNFAGICTACNNAKSAATILGHLSLVRLAWDVTFAPAAWTDLLVELLQMGERERLLATWHDAVRAAWRKVGP